MATTRTTDSWLDDALDGLPAMLTVKETIGVLRCSRRHVYRTVADGRLHGVRATERGSSRLLIPRTSLRSYLESLEAR